MKDMTDDRIKECSEKIDNVNEQIDMLVHAKSSYHKNLRKYLEHGYSDKIAEIEGVKHARFTVGGNPESKSSMDIDIHCEMEEGEVEDAEDVVKESKRVKQEIKNMLPEEVEDKIYIGLSN